MRNFSERMYLYYIDKVKIFCVSHDKVVLLTSRRSERGTRNRHQIIFRKRLTLLYRAFLRLPDMGRKVESLHDTITRKGLSENAKILSMVTWIFWWSHHISGDVTSFFPKIAPFYTTSVAFDMRPQLVTIYLQRVV